MRKISTTRLLVWLLVLLGGILRFYDLGKKSLWVDEAKAVQISRNLEDILPYAQKGNTPPLRYYLTHVLQQGRPPESYVRLPSAFCSLLCIPLVFLIGARMRNSSVGLIAATLFAFSPWQIHHAQDGRMYSVFLLITTIALYALLRAQESGKWQWWILLGGSFAMGSYFNYFALWTSFIIALYVLMSCLVLNPSDEAQIIQSRVSRLRGITISLLVAAVLYLPWLYNLAPLIRKYIAPKSVAVTAQTISVPGLNPFATRYNWDYVEDFLKELGSAQSAAAYSLAILALIGLGVACKNRRDIFLLSVLWFLVPFIILSLSSVRWFFPPRYLIYFHPIYLILAAWGLVSLASWACVAAVKVKNANPDAVYLLVLAFAISSFVAMFFQQTTEYYRREKQDWRGAARYLEAAMNPGDTLVTGQAWTEQALLFYYRKNIKPVDIVMHLYDLGEFEKKLIETPNLWYVSWGPLPEQVSQIVNRYLTKERRLPGSLGDIEIYRRQKSVP